MVGYTKLFNSILASTVWRANDQTRLVWITLLAMADRLGCVEASVPGLADFARVSLEDCERALSELQAPDRYSRSKEREGRRIEEIDGGWRLINHGKYRAKLGADERREYLRLKQREHRSRNKSTSVNNVSDKYTLSTHSRSRSRSKEQKQEKEKSASLSPAAPLKKASDGTRDPFTDTATTERAGRFVERYAELYKQYRNGARYAVSPTRDYAAAVRLCQTWEDDTRLDKLAVIFLTCDNAFAESGSRTIPQFLALASWADGLLAESEQKC